MVILVCEDMCYASNKPDEVLIQTSYKSSSIDALTDLYKQQVCKRNNSVVYLSYIYNFYYPFVDEHDNID